MAAPIFVSDEVASPVTFGARRPVILLPAAFPEMDARMQEAILCHEMLHVERRDWLFTVAEELVRAVFWFHPAIWWLLGEIQLAREQAVDRGVVERTQARDEYVDALLAIAGASPQLDLAPAPLFLRKRHLKQRVVSILKEVRMSKTRLISGLAAGLGILAAACWFVTGTFPLAAAPQVVNDAPGVTVEMNGGVLLHRAPVAYPEPARSNGVQGTVAVEAVLDEAGNVSEARIVSGPQELRKAAQQSVLQWHFKNDVAGATRQVNITFQSQAESKPVAGGTTTATVTGTATAPNPNAPRKGAGTAQTPAGRAGSEAGGGRSGRTHPEEHRGGGALRPDEERVARQAAGQGRRHRHAGFAGAGFPRRWRSSTSTSRSTKTHCQRCDHARSRPRKLRPHRTGSRSAATCSRPS